MLAAYYGEEDICRELFKHIPASTKSSLPTKPENALIDELCYEGEMTALHLASFSGSENVVRAVLNQPAVDVASKSSPSGYTALHLACLSGQSVPLTQHPHSNSNPSQDFFLLELLL